MPDELLPSADIPQEPPPGTGIELAHEPGPVPSAPPATRIELPPLPPPPREERNRFLERLASLRRFVARGYFNPFRAFAFKVDWGRFGRAQAWLLLLSLVLPFLTILVVGSFTAVVYFAGAAYSSVRPPNPVYELAVYPFVWVLAKGYWMAYLAMPLILAAFAWAWAFFTAWSLTRRTDPRVLDFRKALAVFAVLGMMLVPFTTFPFLRLLAILVLVWHISRNLEETFGISFGQFLIKGGIPLALGTFGYSWVERRVETYFPASNELTQNLQAFHACGRELPWPSFRVRMPVSPFQALMRDVADLDRPTRELAIQRALRALAQAEDSPANRFALARRLAEVGSAEGMVFLGRYYRLGQGTTPDPEAALGWLRKAAQILPENPDLAFEEARLLFSLDRRLEAKRRLVALARKDMQHLGTVAQFIRNEKRGSVDPTYLDEVANLYRSGAVSSSVYERRGGRTPRNLDEPGAPRDILAQRIAAVDADGSQWFLRVLVEEYGTTTEADPRVYGERPNPTTEEEMARAIAQGDRQMLELAGDRSYRDGQVATARDYWLRAARALQQDQRRPNADLYGKLAASYDPATARKDPDPNLAATYYLAQLLVTAGGHVPNERVVEDLKRLGVMVDPDLQSQRFLEQCLKRDIPEAWAMMGSRCVNGLFPGVPKNLGRARECYRKAQQLGYQGPVVHSLDGG